MVLGLDVKLRQDKVSRGSLITSYLYHDTILKPKSKYGNSVWSNIFRLNMIKSAEYTKVEPAEYKFTVSIDIIPSAKSLPLWPQDIIDIMETCLENVKQGRGFEGWPRDYCDMKRVIRFCTKEDILGFLELFREHTVKKTSPGPSYLIYHKNDIIQSIPERFLEDEDFSSKVDQYRGWNK